MDFLKNLFGYGTESTVRTSRFTETLGSIHFEDADAVVTILNQILASTNGYSLQQLQKLLADEKDKNTLLRDGWNHAIQIFNSRKSDPNYFAVNQTKFPAEYHIALIAYTGDYFYADFNEKTRGLTTNANLSNFHYKAYFKFMYKALTEMDGEPKTPQSLLYRGVPNKFVVKHGQKVVFQQFISTSASQTVAANFGSGTLFIFEGVKRSIATCLSHHSKYPNEKECLIWPAEGFKVTSFTNSGTKTIITLQSLH